MNRASKPKPGEPATNDSPSKANSNADGGAEAAVTQAEESKSGGAPLLRAKQTQAQQRVGALDAVAAAEAELDISFISGDTVKSLFDFLHIEAGEEGERNLDQVLAAQASLEGRGRAGAAAVN